MVSQDEITHNMPTPYTRWQQSEGIPSIGGYAIEDLNVIPLHPWPRLGGNCIFINLEGSEQANDACLCEIPPGQALEP